jgi:hypothetical protein
LTPGKGATITLDNTTRLRGKVVGADAKPVSGVEILLETSRPRPADPDFPIPHLQLTTQTDAQGAFDTLAEPGEYELFATGPDGLFARIPKLQLKTGQSLEQAVTLAPGVHLRIKAVSSITNQPVAGAKFVIWKELPFADLIAPGSERTTNVDGIADWQSVMPGIQSIDVTSPEYARWGSSTALDHWYPDDDLDNQALRLDLKPGMADVLVKMEPAMHVTGKVIDAAAKPVPDVYVNVEGFQTGDRRYMRQTNAQGQYDLYVPGKWINGGLYHVAVARTPNYQKPSAEGPPFAPKPGGQAEFTVKLE